MTIGLADVSVNVIADELTLTERYDCGKSHSDSSTEALIPEFFTYLPTLMNRDNRCAERR